MPLPLRNRLAELILAAVHDPRARDALAALVRASASGVPASWTLPGAVVSPRDLHERARRASEALAPRPIGPRRGLPETLEDAAALFDAGLYFEVHELLEAVWREAGGERHDALQGLIQVAVGYQHLANGNLGGGYALLQEGSARLAGHRLDATDLTRFAQAVAATIPRPGDEIDWTAVPSFPR